MRRGQLELDRGDNAAAIADLTRAQQLDPANKDIAALLEDARRAPTAAVAEPASAGAAATGGDRRPRAVAGCHTAGRRERLFDRSAPAVQPPQAAWPTCGRDRDGRAGGGAGSRSRSSFWPAYRVMADVNLRQGPGNEYPKIGALAQGTTVAVVERAARLAADAPGRWRQRLCLQEVAGGRPARREAARQIETPCGNQPMGDSSLLLFASARARFGLSDLLRLSVKICHR